VRAEAAAVLEAAGFELEVDSVVAGDDLPESAVRHQEPYRQFLDGSYENRCY
jgi:hypothetical protein